MSASPRWTADLAAARQKNKRPQDRFLQMATVTAQGTPACRTVVFRGLRDDGTHQIKLITDGRSDKLAHLRARPQVELCWYFIQSREQFRFSGGCDWVDGSAADERLRAARVHQWHTISASARQQFVWPAPGEARSDPAAFEGEPPAEPPDTFVLLLVAPDRVDHLRLRGAPQTRRIHTLSNGRWQIAAVNP